MPDTISGPVAELERVRVERDRYRAALLNIHRGLFPENYAPAEPLYEWDAGTIEWVADDIARSLKDDPDARFTEGGGE